MISIRGASEHNLKSIDLDIPRGSLVVVTGVSGSGKSSLAFDTVCAEGRRRYLETFSSYARQFLGKLSRPSVTHIDGLSPAVALDQSFTLSNARSTVGTMTEVYDLLRLLWARAGTVVPGATVPKIERALFSFNSPQGACPRCHGLGVEDRLDPDLLVADPQKSVRTGALRITTPTGYVIYSQVTLDVLEQVCRAHGFTLDVPWRALTDEQRDVILNGSDRIRIPYGKHPLSSRLRWKGITAKPREEGVYKGILPVMEQILRTKRNRNILRFVRSMPCRACRGTRLRPEALAVTVFGLTIADAAALPIDELSQLFESHIHVDTAATRNVRTAVESAVAREVTARCDVLKALGLGYLTLARESTTLSAGEAQRIRLARLATVGLAGVLYVLDEPSVGLHRRDTERLLQVLRAVRDRGNSVLVVEHDEHVVRSADWLVDVGPGAGSRGGELLYNGRTADFTAPGATRIPASRTQAFLTGREHVPMPDQRREGTGTLAVSGLTRNNLKEVAAEFRLGAVNVVTGVSGAGKSTLVEETARLVKDRPGIDKVIAIDQAPIGRTPRSNPATYTGLFDFVRDLFASQPDAVRRGFGKGRFSFNVKGGRCEACEGAGVVHIGMHFLGTASLVCEACDGRRFNDETLEVRYRGRNIDDVLDMPIDEAADFFADRPPIARTVAAMRSLGLGYLTLGHPATMLSGGEAQRVKLAAELARPASGHTLYLLDEPTTGLHPADVALLLAAIVGLVDQGNTVIAIEHDLDVIRSADWIVDVGPGSGAAGGRIVAVGTPESIAANAESVTGGVLREAGLGGSRRVGSEAPDAPNGQAGASPDAAEAARGAIAPPTRERRAPLRLTGVTTHNLQHVDVEIPANQLTVITGVSGSGKSSLAFDTIFAEGQHRFADTFSTYGRRFINRSSEAEFEDVSGLTPAIAIAQQGPSRNPRSTVATLTEIHDGYRVLFSRAGTRLCPSCRIPLRIDEYSDGTSPHSGERRALQGASARRARCPRCGFEGVPHPLASMFSPNSEHGACPRCRGLGFVFECDPSKLVTDPSRPLNGGAMAGHRTGRFYGDPHGQHMAVLFAAGAACGIDFSAPWDALDERARDIAMRGAGNSAFDIEWNYVRGARTGVHRFRSPWPGLLSYVRDEYERKHADHRGEAMDALMRPVVCDACGGGKLRPEFLAVAIGGIGIHQLLAMDVTETLRFFAAVGERGTGQIESNASDQAGSVETKTAAFRATLDLRRDIVARLERLRDAGLAYLTLDRAATTLSGGEAQRVRLAAALGSGLTGITYVLDEPTAGLHSRDTERLVALLHDLRDAGNTVIVVEHDRDVIAAADHLIEIGPGAGAHGGRVVARGTPSDMRRISSSRTAALLNEPAARRGRDEARALGDGIAIRGATVHNLRNVDVDVPSGGLVCVTGVSGSGKSTLVFDVLAPSVAACLAQRGGSASRRRAVAGVSHDSPGSCHAPANCRDLVVHAPFASVTRVEHASVGTSPWSNPATHTGLFDDIREVFAATEAAVSRGLRKQQFSTSAKGGRCEACEGLGEVRVPMDFLPDVWVCCDECNGARYGRDVLASTIDGRSIADVLSMRADEAREFFQTEPASAQGAVSSRIAASLDVLIDVGLGYVTLGQPARTLSGGERQRLVLARALMQPRKGAALYLFDEPTAGLHRDDVDQLLRVFDRLVEVGHTLVVIEHNLDLVARADWVIDMGPEGGTAGGQVVVAGPPSVVAACPNSYTGAALRRP